MNTPPEHSDTFPVILDRALHQFPTKAEFCDAVGIPPYGLSRLLRGTVRPSVEVCIRIAAGANLDLHAVLIGAGHQDVSNMILLCVAHHSRTAAKPDTPRWVTTHELGHLQMRRRTAPEVRKVLDRFTEYLANGTDAARPKIRRKNGIRKKS